MQKVLQAERQWISERAVEMLMLAFVVLVAIVMGVAAAGVFGNHTSSRPIQATGDSRAYGATQDMIHGNLAGGEDYDGESVAQTRGRGQLP